MLPEPAAVRQLLLISGAAGSMSPDVRHRLIDAFPLHQVDEFDPDEDFLADLEPGATVVVAGGDGTTGFVARRLVGSGHPLGILPLGTFNNFARSLNLPRDVDQAIEVIKHGRAQPVTVGRLGDLPFLEAASAGLAGRVVEAGEALKDLHFGELGRELRPASLEPPVRVPAERRPGAFRIRLLTDVRQHTVHRGIDPAGRHHAARAQPVLCPVRRRCPLSPGQARDGAADPGVCGQHACRLHADRDQRGLSGAAGNTAAVGLLTGFKQDRVPATGLPQIRSENASMDAEEQRHCRRPAAQSVGGRSRSNTSTANS